MEIDASGAPAALVPACVRQADAEAADNLTPEILADIAAYADRVVAASPAFTPETRATLVGLLRVHATPVQPPARQETDQPAA